MGIDRDLLESRPGIFIVGSSNVGKRSLISSEPSRHDIGSDAERHANTVGSLLRMSTSGSIPSSPTRVRDPSNPQKLPTPSDTCHDSSEAQVETGERGSVIKSLSQAALRETQAMRNDPALVSSSGSSSTDSRPSSLVASTSSQEVVRPDSLPNLERGEMADLGVLADGGGQEVSSPFHVDLTGEGPSTPPGEGHTHVAEATNETISAPPGPTQFTSGLLSVDLSDASELSSEIPCYGWTIDTKYYKADLSIWMAHLGDEFSFRSLPISKQLDALVMVFDMSDLSSFVTLQDWVSRIDIQKFEILLCIGNKADLLPGHFAHAEYRRHLLKGGESSRDPHPEYLDYGILETEGSSLLGHEEPPLEIRRLCLEWCSQYNIEYIEACASNVDFDKCLSVNGDSQGVERLYGALSAHMWPGMILKSRNGIPESAPVDKEDLSDEESEFEIEYELLSRGSAEPWDGMDESWVALNDHGNVQTCYQDEKHGTRDTAELQASSSSKVPVREEYETRADEFPVLEASILPAQVESKTEAAVQLQDVPENRVPVQEESEVAKATETNDKMHYSFENLEQLMCEISHTRENLRLMPDFQRKEMAAKLAMKMANMFEDGSDDEDGFD